MVNKWKSIESAPKDGRDILVYCTDTEEQMVAFWRDYPEFAWQSAFFRPYQVAFICRPTHWMELPDSPKNTGGNYE